MLASTGLPPETKEVSEKVSAELYLKGHEEGCKQKQAEAEKAERCRRQEEARRRQEILRTVACKLAAEGETEARQYLSRQGDVSPKEHGRWLAAAAELLARETVASSLKELERRLQRMAAEILLEALR